VCLDCVWQCEKSAPGERRGGPHHPRWSIPRQCQIEPLLIPLLLAAAHGPRRGAALAVRMKAPAVPAACLAGRTCAVYKPRGVLSAAADPTHPTLTDLMAAAGVEPLRGHVGRLDLATSGLILVTDDSVLHDAAASLAKRYSLLVAGRHARGSDPVTSLSQPLFFMRGDTVVRSDAARVRHAGSFQDRTLAERSVLLDRVDGLRVDRELARVYALPGDSRGDAKERGQHPGATHLATSMGDWVTEIEVEIQQGRHHQIRRLCKRAGLELLHLRRVAIGPLSLADLQLGIGEVRELSESDKVALYSAALPAVTRSAERREASDRVASERARRRLLRERFRASQAPPRDR
jgi:16S rRNA U516 pseudouridylate synthase RsuA-like enzyme